jgi:hypothetical protein
MNKEVQERINSICRSLQTQTEVTAETKRYLELFPEEFPPGITLGGIGTYIVLRCHSFSALHDARKIVKQIYPKWEHNPPRVGHYYGEICYVEYLDPKYPNLVINIVDLPLDGLPESFTKNGCNWVTDKVELTVKTFVCPA